MAKGIDEGRAIDIVFMDFSKTFDKDLHGRLVCKVGSHGIQDELPSWIQNWSCGRRQRVVFVGLYFKFDACDQWCASGISVQWCLSTYNGGVCHLI